MKKHLKNGTKQQNHDQKLHHMAMRSQTVNFVAITIGQRIHNRHL
jgi:hypothetical protein